MSEHHMIGGSHERRTGPECACGAEWDWWNDCCTSTYAPEATLATPSPVTPKTEPKAGN